MKLNDVAKVVTFYVHEQWWPALNEHRKTAELRILTEDEWRELILVDPDLIKLVCLGQGERVFRLRWFDTVMEGCGRRFVLFCWVP